MRLIPLLFLFLVVATADDYVNEVQGRCYNTKRSYFCTKYKIFKYIDDYQLGNVSLTSDSSVQFINIPSANVSGVTYFGRSRQYLQQDSEIVKILKFMKRRVMKFVNEQGLSFDLPDGAQIVTEEARQVTGKGKKQKKQIILPLLILLKLFKVKIMTGLILMGVVVIKKMLLTAAFILPGVVAAIKHHCKAQQFHVVPYHVDEEHHSYEHEHEHDDGGYAVSGYGGDKHYWDKKKRFSYF